MKKVSMNDAQHIVGGKCHSELQWQSKLARDQHGNYIDSGIGSCYQVSWCSDKHGKTSNYKKERTGKPYSQCR